MSARARQAELGGRALLLPERRTDPVVLRLGDSERALEPGRAGDNLAVYVGSKASLRDDTLPVAGRYERDGDMLLFSPSFGFSSGQLYVVRARPRGEPAQLREFRVEPENAARTAHVTALYPSGDEVPENILRFYVHFSVRMAPHRAADFVRLRDAHGIVDDAAFMEFKQELWNEDRTRLTILLDPGRITRGVATNRALGPALVEGSRYTLSVDAGWQSADGSSELSPHTKHFRVSAPLRERPSMERWSWEPPTPGTRGALEVRFNRPFDRHALRDAVHVMTNDGRTVAGTSHVGENECSWSFVPDDIWVSCDIRIVVDDDLEDVAGNNFRELLDRYVNVALGVDSASVNR